MQKPCLLCVLLSIAAIEAHRHSANTASVSRAVSLSTRLRPKERDDSDLSDVNEQNRTKYTIQYIPLLEVESWRLLQYAYASEMLHKSIAETSLDLVLFGDSITESLRGTVRGIADEKIAGVPAVWHHHFGSWNALAFGIAGDRTLNLLWRLTKGGEAPGGVSCKFAGIQIGTNDFYNHYMGLWGAVPLNHTAEVAEEVTAGVLANARVIRERWPHTHIALLAILPRGNADPTNATSLDLSYPSMFTPVIQAVNSQLESHSSSQDLMSFVDCSSKFIVDNDHIDAELMQDSVHPSAKGMDHLLRCLKHALSETLRVHTTRS